MVKAATAGAGSNGLPIIETQRPAVGGWAAFEHLAQLEGARGPVRSGDDPGNRPPGRRRDQGCRPQPQAAHKAGKQTRGPCGMAQRLNHHVVGLGEPPRGHLQPTQPLHEGKVARAARKSSLRRSIRSSVHPDRSSSAAH